MDRRFQNAYFDPADIEFAGRRLYPWCLKHRVWLTALESPFVLGQRDPTPQDVILFAHVCSEGVIGRMTLRDRYHLARMRYSEYHLKLLTFRAVDYMMLGHWPKFWDSERKAGGNATNIPWPLATVACLIANGIDEQRAWEMPECQAIWLSTAFAAANGADVRVIDSDQEAFMEQEEKEAAGAGEPPSNPAGA